MEDRWGSGERETLALQVVTIVTSAQPRPVGDQQLLPSDNLEAQRGGELVDSHTLLVSKPSTPRNSQRLRVTKPSCPGPAPAWAYLGPEAGLHGGVLHTWPEERCAFSKAIQTPADYTRFPNAPLEVRGST